MQETMLETMQEDKILVSLLPLTNVSGKQIAFVTLNKPKALNALDLDMVQAMQACLDKWRDDESIVAVVLDANSDKAFCAGGDIVSLYKAMQAYSSQSNDSGAADALPEFSANFFAQEYRLDYSLHTFNKPIVCWGHGIVMGGGLGLLAGASHSVVTETSKVAMPEVTIGLFPDVGASYFLNNMPDGVGAFLGLTGCRIGAKDCVEIGLADHFISHQQKQQFVDELLALSDVSHSTVTDLCEGFSSQEASAQAFAEQRSVLAEFSEHLAIFSSCETAEQFETSLTELCEQFGDSKTLSIALNTLKTGSPLSAVVMLEQLKRGKDMSLLDCFKMELSMAYQCSVTGEFQEGVRALLIDKDNNTNWLYKTYADVPASLVDAHFNRYQDQAESHPLADLTD